jgi:hypothetical protein
MTHLSAIEQEYFDDEIASKLQDDTQTSFFLARLPKQQWVTLRNSIDAGLNVVALNVKATLRGLHIASPAERLASKASTDTLMEAAAMARRDAEHFGCLARTAGCGR